MTAEPDALNGYRREGLLRLLEAVFAPPKRKTAPPGICPRCGIRPKTGLAYCDECRRAVTRASYWRVRARRIAAGEEIRYYQKIRPTENTNNTFFSEHYDYIKQCAFFRAVRFAKMTRDFSSVPDYTQDILLTLWKESLSYTPADWVSPEAFIALKVKYGAAMLRRKLGAKKRIFWDSVLFLEDFVKLGNKHDSWEDFIQPSDL